MKKLLSVFVAMMLLISCFAVSFAEEAVGMSNPWTETDEAGLQEAVGFTFMLPEGATDVTYRYSTDNMAEATFTLEDLPYTARLQAKEAFEDISGLYYDWTWTCGCTVNYCAGKEMSVDSEGMTIDVCLWYDTVAGMMYSLTTQAEDLDGFDLLGVAMEMAPAMQESDEAGVMEATGMSFVIPEGATDVYYSYNANGLAEAQFLYDNIRYTAHMQMVNALTDISGVYYDEIVAEEDCTVSYCEGKVIRATREGDTIDVCLWYDVVPGVGYSLSVQESDLDGFDIEAVAEMIFVPLQGDAE